MASFFLIAAYLHGYLTYKDFRAFKSLQNYQNAHAIHLAQTIAQHNPEHRRLLLNIANKFLEHQNFDQAIVYYQKVQKLSAHKPSMTLYTKLGDAYKGKKEYQKAIEYYDKSDDELYYENSAWCSFKLKQYPQAIKYYQKVIQSDLHNTDTYKNMAYCSMMLQDFAAAKKYLQHAIERRKQDASLYIAYFTLNLLNNQAFDRQKLHTFYEVSQNDFKAIYRFEILQILYNIAHQKNKQDKQDIEKLQAAIKRFHTKYTYVDKSNRLIYLQNCIDSQKNSTIKKQLQAFMDSLQVDKTKLGAQDVF
jgi:tetratricopeptide (TPR) repeat protein